MLLDLNIPAGIIKDQHTIYTGEDSTLKFPLLTIDRDSYIVSGTIVSGLDFNWQTGLHSIQIGRHSAISQQILFMVNPNHNYNAVFQGQIEGIDEGDIAVELRQKGEILIGNDCWIGHGATIMSGVVIHDGAVVAANSTVTKDVMPYEIVGGNPAKHIKYRFDQDTIKKLLSIKWWTWSRERLIANKGGLTGDVLSFTEMFYEKSKLEEATVPSDFSRITEGTSYLFVADTNDPIPVYPRIIQEFAGKFNDTDAELIILMQGECNDIINLLESMNDYNVSVNLYWGDLHAADGLLNIVDYYITSRATINLQLAMDCYRKGVQIISGISIPVF